MDISKIKTDTALDNLVKIQIILTTNGYFQSGIRDFVMNFVKNITSFSEKWAFRFQTIVDELASNAIEHGCKAGDEIKITLLAHTAKSVEIIVEDPGNGDKKVNAADLRKIYQEKIESFSKAEYLGIRGRGLAQIIHSWSDEVAFEDSKDGGVKVKVIKYLKEEDKQA